MSDPVQLAKNAREQLSQALNALQTNAHVPDELMAVADPIAEAMSVLHRIERSSGANLEGRDEALANVRGALDTLQKITAHHPATEVVMEAVAISLSKVHALARYVPPAPAPAPAPVAAAPAPAPVTQAPATGPRGTQFIKPAPAAAAPQPAPAAVAPVQPAAPVPAPQAYAPPQPAPQAYAPPQPAPQPAAQAYAPPQPAPQPAAQAYAPPQPAPQAPAAQAYAPPQPAPQPARPQAPAPAPAPGTKPLDVELGTHSPSNFYKGLGGNDVIEHGGIFVATYKIPKIGAPVALRVLLPGDYEFHASAVVQWTREAGGSGDSSEPGFGARFTQITPEGRQLVYRYTRNREPIFYDDL